LRRKRRMPAASRGNEAGKGGEAATANARLEPMRCAWSVRSVARSRVARTCSIATQTARGTSEEAPGSPWIKTCAKTFFKPNV
jgi:hypothetical protein